jgi:hypothetical protein
MLLLPALALLIGAAVTLTPVVEHRVESRNAISCVQGQYVPSPAQVQAASRNAAEGTGVDAFDVPALVDLPPPCYGINILDVPGSFWPLYQIPS